MYKALSMGIDIYEKLHNGLYTIKNRPKKITITVVIFLVLFSKVLIQIYMQKR